MPNVGYKLLLDDVCGNTADSVTKVVAWVVLGK